jgi:carbon-monoxide dehydrogenase medium subunit
VRAHTAERSLIGTRADQPTSGRHPPEHHPFDQAGRIAADRDADPHAQPYADVEYQRQVIAVLVGRALLQASADRRTHAGHDEPGGNQR